MTTALDMAEVGFLVGDPARANILSALLDGRAKTAGELAYFARVTPQTASLHLRRLTDANLISLLQQGRHRYFRLASPLVARMLESISAVAAVQMPPRQRFSHSPRDAALRAARLCYDHLAGQLGVDIADALAAHGFVALDDEGGEVTIEGRQFFARLGIELDDVPRRRAFCRPCLDWTERRYHIAGSVGAALARHAFDNGWLARLRDTRALAVTAAGRTALADGLGLRFEPIAEAA
jgi:DNA-binding transcriptional ArsR family regulator